MCVCVCACVCVYGGVCWYGKKQTEQFANFTN